jgi:hypothetical protein
LKGWLEGRECIHADLNRSYSALKKLLQDTMDAPHAVYIPTKLSLSAGIDSNLTAQEMFWRKLEKDIDRIDAFTLVGTGSDWIVDSKEQPVFPNNGVNRAHVFQYP